VRLLRNATVQGKAALQYVKYIVSAYVIIIVRQILNSHFFPAAKLAAALLRVAGVTAGLAEGNGRLPPGL